MVITVLFLIALAAILGFAIGWTYASTDQAPPATPAEPDLRPILEALAREAGELRNVRAQIVAARDELKIAMSRSLPEPKVVQVEKIVEKMVPVPTEKVRVERVEVPVVMPTAQVAKGAPPAPASTFSTIVYMDAHLKKTKAIEAIDARLRRATMYRGELKYMAAHQDEQGRWIYREVAH